MTDSAQDPSPATPANASGVERVERALEAATRGARTAQRYAQIALGVAVAACLAAAWISAGAIDRHQATQRVAKEVEELRAELKRVAADRGRAWKLASAALSGASDAEPGELPASEGEGAQLPGLTEAAEFEELRARVMATQARTEEVEAGLIEWGEETKRFVSEQIAATTQAHRQERAQELRVILERLRDLEAR